MHVPHYARVTLSETPTLDPHGFFLPKLLNGSVEYDVDLSLMGCGCVAAFYTVELPAIGSDGQPDNTDGHYYCDANNITGEWCNEMDIMEANTYSFRTTAHTCDGTGPHYTNCDRGGNAVTDLQEKGVLGPGKKIDTGSPFHVKIEFKESSYTLTVSQGDNTDVSEMNNGYLSDMARPLDGRMAFVMSNWGSDDIPWLQHDACSGSCDNLPDLVFANLTFNSEGYTPTPSPPGPIPTPTPPSKWAFGDACADKSADDCDGTCDCRWSWPRDSSWDDPDAHCRCKP